MILLSKAMDVERDHLIHRKRSPFPYEGKALTPLKVGVRPGRARHFPIAPRFIRSVCRLIWKRRLPQPVEFYIRGSRLFIN